MTRFALRNLVQRKTRTAISVAAVAAQVAFVLLLVGLSTGTLAEVGQRIENIGADLLVLPPGGQAVLAMSTAVMPLEPIRAALLGTAGVEAVTPVVIGTTTKMGGYSMIFGIEPATYGSTGRGALELTEGRLFAGPFDLVVDQRLARAKHLAVGTVLELLNHEFTISGIVRDGAGVRMYLPIGTMQDLLGREGKASAFFVRARDRAAVPQVIERLRGAQALQGCKLISNDQYAEFLGTSTTGLREFIGAVTATSVAFGFLIVSLAMYTTIIERTRQIGILKSLGAEGGFIARAFVVEALLLALLGVPAGVALGWACKLALQRFFPTLIILITARWVAYATAIALSAALLGSLYPALRASRIDPVVALSYE